MAMGMHRFRFADPPDDATFRARLRAEVGTRRSGPRCVETAWSLGSDGTTTLEILSMNAIAFVYAAKVCLDLGGEHLRLTPSSRPWVPPAWTATPWVQLPFLKRLRLTIGPTPL